MDIINVQPALISSDLFYHANECSGSQCRTTSLTHQGHESAAILPTAPEVELHYPPPPHAHSLHHITEQGYPRSRCCFWTPIGAFLMSFLFTGQILSLLSFHSDGNINTCALHLWGSPAPHKMAGSLDMEYPWPVTLQWPEEVMSGENVPGRQSFQTGQVVPPWDFLSRLSHVCPSS